MTTFVARVEVDALGPVDVAVAEQGRLPAAERVVGDRHRDRDVDPDHADLDVELELAGCAAVAREDRGAVAVRVVVDRARSPRRRSRRASTPRPGRRSRRGSRPCPARRRRSATAPRKKPSPRTRRGRRRRRSRLRRRADRRSDATLSRCSRGDERAHLGRRRRVPSPTFTFGIRCLDRLDQLVGDTADGDEHRDRHAALAGRAVAAPRPRRRRPSRCRRRAARSCGSSRRRAPGTRLPVRRRRLVDVARDRRRADERDRGDVGMLEQRVDRDLVAVDHVEDAVGKPASREQLGGIRTTRTGPSRTA